MNTTTIEINLELELDDESVRGRARTADGSVREFSGWIGLMGLVDSLLDGARQNGAAPAASESSKETDSDGSG